MQNIVTFLKRLTHICFLSFHHRFVVWTKPCNTSLILGTVTDLARSKSELVAENALLRQQLIILRRQVKRPTCAKTDRLILVLLARSSRAWKQAVYIVQPETLLHWHRQGFRLFWKYKSRAASSKPKIPAETVVLIKEMAAQNRLWGAERIRGELRKLGIRVSKRTIQKGVQRFTVVENSDISPNRLTELETLLILPDTGALHAPHFKQRGLLWPFSF